MIGVVVPTKTDAYARRLLRSLATCAPGWLEIVQSVGDIRVVFVENGLSDDFVDDLRCRGIKVVRNPDPFVFARAVNLGVAALNPRADILIMNDDAVFCSPNPITRLEALLEESAIPGGGLPIGASAESVKKMPCVRDVFGVVGPRIEGGVGNPDQSAPLQENQVLTTDKAICFVAALIPRVVWDVLGGLDERYTGYGMDDADACKTLVNAGYKLGVTGAATVRHVGDPATGEMHGSYSQLGREEHTRLYLLNQQIYREKWGEGGRGSIG